MNATDQLAQAATNAGWKHNIHEAGSRLTGCYTKGQQILLVRYRLFGSDGGRRLCQWHGIDDMRWINWGIEMAHVKALIERDSGVMSWATEHVFDGKNKKSQVLAYLKEN